MRISDWSSDVCSSDLDRLQRIARRRAAIAIVDREHRTALPREAKGAVLHDRRRYRRGLDDRAFGLVAQRSGHGVIGRNVARGRRQPAVDTLDHKFAPAAGRADILVEIGRASGRERVCQYVWIAGGAVSLKKKQ